MPPMPDTLKPKNNPSPTQIPAFPEELPERTVNTLVDDFIPQPYQGDSVYFYNRIGGDRGALNNSIASWNNGAVDITISDGNTWGGIWMSLDHPIREGQSINFSAILPSQIQPAYQGRIIGIDISVFGGTRDDIFRIELKDKNNDLKWSNEITLNGNRQDMNFGLPPLQDINHLVLVLDHARPGDHVMVENISLTASTSIIDTPTAAFIWSYGMLLDNWNPSTGLVRDKAKDASGEFDAIQATGSLAAVTALAEQIGIVNHADAVAIVAKIGDTLLNKVPRNHGLWPHWVKLTPAGMIEIVPGTEWSSVDTVIAAIGLLVAQQGLGLDTSGTEEIMREIEWSDLLLDNGISHGYTYDDKLIPYAWDVFGGESWLVELAYASATGNIAPLSFPSAPTANGSGFIDELAWLYVLPPSGLDYWGTDWGAYRNSAAEKQTSFFETKQPSACFSQFGLFGLSAAESPVPARVPKGSIYQAFGVGGQFAPAHDGSDLLGSPAIAPHYSAMIASLHPQDSIKMWEWLIKNGYFTPLNNVESLTFPVVSNCDVTRAEWNQLKGSWNLALQALGWGRYLAERDGYVPALWQATKTNLFLRRGYLLLAPNETATSAQQNEDLVILLKKSNISCDEETEYSAVLAGIYRYRLSNTDGYTQYCSVEQVLDGQVVEYSSALGWPRDPGVPYWLSSTAKNEMDNITTRFGTFQALRFDTFKEYRIQTMNHSDPSGTVKRSEWYVCGIGLVRAIMDYKWTYQLRSFEQQSELELISFTPLH